MDEKITATGIIAETARILNSDRDKVSAFTKEFYALIEEALFRDGIVKIGGFGTFRLEEVQPRESVDVTTGNKIQIAGHKKVVFIPENSLAEMVNSPLAHLETVELENENDIEQAEKEMTPNDEIKQNDDMTEPLKRLAEEAVELRGLLDEINSLNDETPQSAEETEAQKETETARAQDNQPIMQTAPTPKLSNENAEQKNSGKQETTENQRTVTPESTVSASEIIRALNKEENKQVKGSSRLWITVAILLAISIIAVLLYANRDFFSATAPVVESSSSQAVETADMQGEEPEPEFLTNIEATDITMGLPEETEATEMQPTTEMAVAPTVADTKDMHSELYSADFGDLFNRPRVYNEFKDTVTLTEGSRLTWVALKQYGHKDFWVYIYEANRDIIANPNNIKVGTQLRIPVVEPALIDANSEECLRYARYLHDIYIQADSKN